VRLEGLGGLKKWSYLIGNRTRVVVVVAVVVVVVAIVVIVMVVGQW
jgi:hypothetical protein